MIVTSTWPIALCDSTMARYEPRRWPVDTLCLPTAPGSRDVASPPAAWLADQDLNESRAAFRLFCLPYAGGGAAIYRGWPAIAPGHVQVCAIELPGRGQRMAEAPFQRLTPMVRALA